MLSRERQDLPRQFNQGSSVKILLAQLHGFDAGGQGMREHGKKRPTRSLMAIGNQVEREINAGHENEESRMK